MSRNRSVETYDPAIRPVCLCTNWWLHLKASSKELERFAVAKMPPTPPRRRAGGAALAALILACEVAVARGLAPAWPRSEPAPATSAAVRAKMFVACFRRLCPGARELANARKGSPPVSPRDQRPRAPLDMPPRAIPAR